MPTAELIEKVARAIYEKRNGPGCYAWGLRPKAHKEPYLSDARAALSVVSEAMRQVSPEMVAAWAGNGGAEPGSPQVPAIINGARRDWLGMLAVSPLGKGE